ncbi:putative tetratricopeptide repeat protein 41 [Megalops cyprinoides]|uniref:putative tetratricopeptide repeat protein 41 n=1 Tax=Megalops cyprinoides TaxID=118141 RepID=UPI001863DD57|nr:putative tetratricopeptide repeat protein 41 [Megalops cyprinoides]
MELQEDNRGAYPTLIQIAPLQPYLCSVPDDLPQEKEYLRSHIFPQLDTLCQTRGTCFRALDLQWSDGEMGAEEEGEGHDHHSVHNHRPVSSQRLKVSLDLISCSPFFLCLLGHRYGQWRSEGSPPLPASGARYEGPSDVERNLHLASKSGYPWVLQGRNQTCSLTELEIAQAVRVKDPRGALFFYFRDYSFQEGEGEAPDERQRALLLKVWTSQTEYERRRMRELKTWIVDRCLPVRFFRNVEELGDLVKRDWSCIIEQLYRLDAQSEHSGQFSFEGNSGEPEKSILLLCGPRGCGKTSLVAWWLQVFCKKNLGLLVIPHFPGLSLSTTDVRTMLRQCISLLRQAHYGLQAEWSERVEERVEPRPICQVVQDFLVASALGPCVLVLDGLDQLTGTLGLSAQQVKELQWLPDALPTWCKLIVTATSTDLPYKSLTCRKDVQVLNCPSLSDAVTRQNVLLRHLALPCKEVPGPMLQSIMGKKLGLLPMFLAILGNDLREEEEEEELMEEYLEVDSIPELWAKVIKRWINDYSWASETRPKRRKRVPPPTAPKTELRGWVWDTLCLIHLSYSGLRAEEVPSLLEEFGYHGAWRVLPLNWALFRSAAGPWVQERPGGQLTFTHQSLSQAVELLLWSE